MRTLAHATLGDCIIVAFARQLAAQDWKNYERFLRANLGQRQRSLVISETKLSNEQRRRMEDIIGPARERDRRVAIVTCSTLVRGFAKALSLFDPAFRGFSPGELEQAFHHVELPPASFPVARRLANELCAQVGLPPLEP